LVTNREKVELLRKFICMF